MCERTGSGRTAAAKDSTFGVVFALILAGVGWSRPARALQPLQQFLQSARHSSPDNREAEANVSLQSAQAEIALGRALPGLNARGTYTRNQYNVVVALPLGPGKVLSFTIQPYNQFDGFFTLNAPLVDLASFQRISAAKTATEAASRQAEATVLQVQAQVVQDYYQLVANQALVTASQKALEVAQDNLKLTQTRQAAGSASGLDTDRAQAQVEQQIQQLATAQLQVALSERALASSSGLQPDLNNPPALNDDLHPEPPLEQWMNKAPGLPQVAAAQDNTRSASEQAKAARLVLVPSLSGSFTEHVSNAAGFVGHDASFQGVLALNWNIDYTTFMNWRAQDAVVSINEAREARTNLFVTDSIHRSWNTVQASIARSHAARAQATTSNHAAELAQDRYSAGAATQLDLLQAQRDAFTAEVSRIQADADLANARAQLRLATGEDLSGASTTPGGTP
jgi:outer membrane protein TolC